MVLWLLGISGSGKTTLGLKLKEYFEKNNKPSCIIDGDDVRNLFDNDLGFTKDDRIANVKRIILAAFFLDKCGIYTIVCNQMAFEHMRELCRKKIQGYNEIYLCKNLENSIKNDVKGIYKNNFGKTSIVGIDIPFEKPEHPDLVIDVDNETIEESYQKIITYIGAKV
jgi:adenylylsulfate kinase